MVGKIVCALVSAILLFILVVSNELQRDPRKIAWGVFVQINASEPGQKGYVAKWEMWPEATRVFDSSGHAPTKDEVIPSRDEFNRDLLPLQLEIAMERPLNMESTAWTPSLNNSQLFESRMNDTTFEFIVDSTLYTIEGQQSFFLRNRKMIFPPGSKEVKAGWRKISLTDTSRYHFVIYKDSAWGLTALHVSTKHFPDWLWMTFEHEENYRDTTTRQLRLPTGAQRMPDEISKHLPGKWGNYVLIGIQTEFENPKILANSQIESSFVKSSSCITCHKRATVGIPGLKDSCTFPPSKKVPRLSIFKCGIRPVEGYVGEPDTNWFIFADGRTKYYQLDYVWSLSRAK